MGLTDWVYTISFQIKGELGEKDRDFIVETIDRLVKELKLTQRGCVEIWPRIVT